MTPRQQRGLTLAATAKIRQRRWQFDVPSQTNAGASYNLVCLIHEMNESGAVAAFPTLTACTITHFPAQEAERSES